MKKFLTHILYIIEGYSVWLWNIITFKTYKKSIARLKLCKECKHNNNGICDICGCIIKAKVHVNYPEDKNGISIDGCPEKKW